MPKYLMFVLTEPLVWHVLKKGKTVECETYGEAMEVALDQARIDGLAGSPTEAQRLTVAVVSDRNWNPGTATVQLKPVTEWEG